MDPKKTLVMVSEKNLSEETMADVDLENNPKPDIVVPKPRRRLSIWWWILLVATAIAIIVVTVAVVVTLQQRKAATPQVTSDLPLAVESDIPSATITGTTSHASTTAASGAVVTNAATVSNTKPIIGVNFQDPGLLQVGNTWYAYAGINFNPEPLNVLLATSTDFVNWDVRHGYDVLPKVGAWANATAHVWAPDANQLAADKFVLYYSASSAKQPGKHCVGAAHATKPEGPYIAEDTPMFCDLPAGGAIDPDGFVDPKTNNRYVIYKVDGNGVGHGGMCSNSVAPIAPTPIMIQQVSPDDGTTFIGSATQLLTNDPIDGPNVEGPAITYDATSQTYFLLYSSQCFATSKYTIRVATSKNLMGPYTRQAAPFLQTGDTAAKVFAPGCIDFSPDGTKAIFHGDTNMGWFKADGTKRVRALYAMDIIYQDGQIYAGNIY